MAQKVLFYNAKGGQGKTTLAVNYALYSDAHFYTNEYKVGTEDLYKDILTKEGREPNRFNVITPNKSRLAVADRAVFDFGGSLDDKIPAVARACDLCIIPVHYQSRAELRPLFIMIKALSEFNQNLLIVINNTAAGYIPNLAEGLRRETIYPIMVVRHSAFMTYLANEGLTPFELDDQIRGAPTKALETIKRQLRELFDFIKEY